MSEQYPGGFINKTAPTLNPALGNAAPGVWNMTQVQQAIKAGTWPAYDPYSKYTTLLLHGDGTNGGQNNTFLDSSTNNFTITRNGNTTQGSFSPYGSNWSNYFNTTFFYVPTTVGNFLCTGSSSGITATMECWVYVTQYATGASPWMYGSMFCKGATYINFGVRDGKVRLYWYDASSAANTVDSASTSDVPLNTWTHIALTINGSTIKIYVNGVLNTTSATFNGVNTAGSGTQPLIGVEDGGDTWFYGYISNLRITNTVVYSASFTPSTTPLTAVTGTQLLTCQSNRFVDNSASNNAITFFSSAYIPSVQRFSPFAPSAAYSTATIGGSGYFDGSGDYLTIPDNAAWNMGSGDFTAEAWIYPLSFANEAMIMGQWSGDTGGTTLNWALMFSSGSTGYMRLITSSNGSSVLFDLSTSTFALTLNMWQHVAAVRSGSTFTLYINGVSKATTTNASALYDATNNFTIGAESNTQSQYFNGYIANARVVKGTAVYTSAFTPPTSPVASVSGTSLLFDCTNAAIFDNAMMNDLETVGNAQISTSVKKYGTGSMYFDGSGDWLLSQTNQNFNFGTGDFTMEGWFYQTGLSSDYPGIVSNPLAWGNAGAWAVLSSHVASGVRKLQFYCYNYSSGSPLLLGTTTLSDSTWYYFAVTRSGSTFRLFLNGTLEATTTFSGNLNSASSACVVGVNQTAYPFQGYIDDLRITKGYARYTANFTPPTSQLQDQ